MAVERLARAKLNLALHVTGQRADGYHLLDSLVAFADLGDRIRVEPAEGLALVIDGPMAAGLPAGEDNLVWRAARAFGVGTAGAPGAPGAPGTPGARIRLTKNLPLASGIGGGSADAAATLLALAALWGRALPPPEAVLALGADVPVCLAGRPARMRGIGEAVAPLTQPLPAAWVVLVNPGVAVSTPAVFGALRHKVNPPLPAPLPAWPDALALATFLAGARNDLEPPAVALAPVIGQVLAALAADPGVLLARMSGSGATCFGLCASPAAAKACAQALAARHPDWWVRAAGLAGAA